MSLSATQAARLRGELLADIGRLATTRQAETPLDRAALALRLKSQVARIGLGDQVRLNLMVMAATLLLALERHDELQRPAPAASARLRELAEAEAPTL